MRDHTATAVEVLSARTETDRAGRSLDELVAAQPDGAGGWHLAVIRHGQLAAAGTAREGVRRLMPVVDALCAGAQAILPDTAPLGGALVEETAPVGMLGSPSPGNTDRAYITRLGLTPLHAAGRWAAWAATARSARLAAEQAAQQPAEHPPINYGRLLSRPGTPGPEHRTTASG